MSARQARRVGSFLPPPLLRRLAAHLDDATRLRALWGECVRPPLAEHAEPGEYAHGVLEIRVASSAWAARLRQHQPELLRRLRALPGMEGLRELRVRVRPAAAAAPVPAPAPGQAAPSSSRLPAAAAAQLRSLAESVGDPALRAALRRFGAPRD